MTLTPRLDKRTTIRLLKIATHVGALLPLVILLWDFRQGQLGAEPIREITLRTGKSALILLVLSLAVTPANIISGWKQVLPLRKLLGLYAFFYVSLHFLIFIWLDYGLDLALLQVAIFEKRYALVGLAAFLILVPLAATSTRWGMRKLGKNWKRLHRLVYGAGILAAVHFLWLVKNAYTEPLIYTGIIVLLLLIRVRPLKRRILRWQRTLRKKWMRRSFPSSQQMQAAD